MRVCVCVRVCVRVFGVCVDISAFLEKYIQSEVHKTLLGIANFTVKNDICGMFTLTNMQNTR